MRTQAHQLKALCIGLTIDQDQIRFDVTIPMIVPLSSKRMIVAALWQRYVLNEEQ